MCQGINGTVETTSPPATNPPIGNNSNGLRRPNEPRLSNKAPQLPNGLDSTSRRSEQRDWELTPTTTTSHAANICLRYFAYRPSVEVSIEVNIDSLPRFELDEVPTATMNIRGTDSTDKVWNASLAPQPTTPLPFGISPTFFTTHTVLCSSVLRSHPALGYPYALVVQIPLCNTAAPSRTGEDIRSVTISMVFQCGANRRFLLDLFTTRP
jgi:hypothetical protein